MTRKVAKLIQKPNIAVLPIVAITLVASAVAAGLGLVTLKQADEFAVERQGEVLARAIAAHAEQLGRQGIPQVFWQEAAEKVRARDLEWMDENYGPYLHEVLGYRQSFVLDPTNMPIYGAIDGSRASTSRYDVLKPVVSRWVAEIRSGTQQDDRTGFISESKQYLDGTTARLVVSAHTASLAGRPSLVTVSTIIPDIDRTALKNEPPHLLVAVGDLGEDVLSKIARDYGFKGLEWGKDQEDGRAARTLLDDQGNEIGVLTWIPDLPAAEFVEKLKPALLISFAVLLFASSAAVLAARSLAKARASAAESGYDARHDALTGLANRRLFADELSQALAHHHNSSHSIALLSVDLDRFKELNDGCGHQAGDEALQTVARRILEVVGDNGLVARVGGDEFEIVLKGGTKDEVDKIGVRLIERLNQKMLLEDSIEWQLGCSIGVAFSDGGDVDDLVRRADLAMSTAKSRGRNRLQYFEEAMDDRLKERITMERGLRSALLHGYLSVDYQPLIECHTGKTIGAEALIRWLHPIIGQIPPERFLPVAESTGLIADIDRFVLARVCQDALQWPELIVSVNVSAHQILSADIVSYVRNTLKSTRLPATRLEFEMTEKALLVDEERAAATIEGLRNLGVRVALDDVGVGYSSLSHLRRLAFSKIKIDRTLIGDIGLKADANEIVFSLVRIGKSLRMKVIGEGVETASQRQFLEAAGCDALQGFLFSQPLSADRLTDFLQDACDCSLGVKSTR